MDGIPNFHLWQFCVFRHSLIDLFIYPFLTLNKINSLKIYTFLNLIFFVQAARELRYWPFGKFKFVS